MITNDSKFIKIDFHTRIILMNKYQSFVTGIFC